MIRANICRDKRIEKYKIYDIQVKKLRKLSVSHN